MQEKYIKLLILGFMAGAFCMLSFKSIMGQQKVATATYYPTKQTLQLRMADFIKIEQLPKDVLLIDAQNGIVKKFSLTAGNIISGGRVIQITSLILPDPNALPEFDVCSGLVSVVVPFQAEPTKDFIALSAQVGAECSQPTTTYPPIVITGTVEADEANVLVTGAFTAVKGAKPVYIADVKAEYDFVGNRSKVHVAPFFSLKANTEEKSDPDQFRVGIKVYGRIFTGKLPKPFTFIRAEATGELESNTEFTVKNILAKPTLQFYTKDIYLSSEESVIERAFLKFIPSLGAEVGRNVRSPIKRDERGIARIVGGLTLKLVFPETPLKAIGVKKLSWENAFTQRWFLKPEQAYEKDDSNNLQLRNFGRKPRSYFTSKFNFGITDFFAPSIAYEWGDLPPLYNRVNHKVTVGFTFGFRRGEKE